MKQTMTGSTTIMANDPRNGRTGAEEIRDRLRRRAAFLRELADARELRRRVAPRRSRQAEIRVQLRMRTYRAD